MLLQSLLVLPPVAAAGAPAGDPRCHGRAPAAFHQRLLVLTRPDIQIILMDTEKIIIVDLYTRALTFDILISRKIFCKLCHLNMSGIKIQHTRASLYQSVVVLVFSQ